MDLISRESLINKLDPWYKKIKKTAPDNLAEGFMQVDGLIRHESSAFEGMTNGEVFQAIFPCDEVLVNGLQEGIVHFSMKSNPDSMDCFDLEWWNSPYQKGGE